jgi:acyl-CoA thioester hydrolase
VGVTVGAPFRHRMRVRYNECDPQNAVFNANYLTYFDIAVSELWREAMGSYESMLADGIDMVVAEASVRYLAPLRFDEEFDVRVSVARLGTTSLVSAMAIERDGDVVAEGELRHVFIAASDGKKAPIPERVRAALERYAA